MTNRVSSSDSLEKDYLLAESFEAEPAPTECVMIKEEPDSIDYDLSERNNLEDDFQDESTLDLGPSTSIPNIEQSMLHASFVPETNLSTLKRKANDQPSYSSATTANLRHLVMPSMHFY
uniref:Uncharacterized protein n=1 Tax=Clastoptera arizonana TaxID=38151 RepID=A0A1B6DDP6_9HEMI